MVLIQFEAQLSHQIKNTAFYKQLLWDPSEPQYSCYRNGDSSVCWCPAQRAEQRCSAALR